MCLDLIWFQSSITSGHSFDSSKKENGAINKCLALQYILFSCKKSNEDAVSLQYFSQISVCDLYFLYEHVR